VPVMLQREGLDELVCRCLHLGVPPARMTDWAAMLDRIRRPTHSVRIAVVGKYIGLQDAYKSVYEAITHGGIANDARAEIVRVDAENIEKQGAERQLAGMDGILVPGGFGNRGIEGKIQAAQFAREKQVPYLGLCLGMQIATIEFARNVCGLKGAHSTEFEPKTPHPVICLIEEQKNIKRMGGTMRLGGQPCKLTPGTRAAALYGTDTIRERHRHRYEFNNDYRERMQREGFVLAGMTPDGELVEIIEQKNHPFFVASQFHPEFQSKPHRAHPLFRGFIEAALKRKTA